MMVNRNPEYFLTVAKLRNISHAAQELYITQSSLSQHISKLESELGVKLFDRSHNPLHLTEAGRLYQSYLESSQFLYQKLEVDLGNSQLPVVDIGMGTWRGSLLVPMILPELLEKYPHTQFNFHESPNSQVPELVDNGDVDFAIINTPATGIPDTMTQEIIAHERIMLIMHCTSNAAKDFQAALMCGKEPDYSLLLNERYISLHSDFSVDSHVGRWFDQNRLAIPERIYTSNYNTAVQLVKVNLGFCFMVESGTTPTVVGPNVVSFDLHSDDMIMPTSLVYRRNSYLSPLVRDTMDIVKKHYWRLLDTTLPRHS